jgi:glycosyltransferase involved in cell wall biosynthesis
VSAPLRIGIDARAAAEVPGGRGRVVRELIAELGRLDHEHEISLYARERWDGAPADPRLRWRLHPQPDPLWHLRVAGAASRSCDVYYSTNSYLTAWLLIIPSVVLVCDMVTYRPELLPQRRARIIEQATLPLAVRRARRLVAISQATADDLVARFPAAGPRTDVVLLAADERYAAAGDGPAPDAGFLRGAGIDGPYVLGVGTLEPRKNLPRLIEAFASLPQDLRAGRRLVLVGASGWDTDATTAAIARHGDVVRALGHVAEEDLPALYRGADVVACPSLYEGFGLPVLEAMAAGAPVLTSDRSSLPEVAGDAAVLVDPTDTAAIAAGLRRLLGDRALRERLAGLGRERARAFSWTRCARETLAVLERAARR